MAPELSLKELSRLVRLVTPESVLAGLREAGVIVEDAGGNWRPLLGGREFSQLTTEPRPVEGVISMLTIEVSRMADNPDQAWVDNIILSPGEGANNEWHGAMRSALARSYQSDGEPLGGAESFHDGPTAMFLLLTAGPGGTPCAIVRRRNPEPRTR